MSKFCTIQKLAEDVGIHETSITKLIKAGVLTKHYLQGMSRIFIDTEEFNSKMFKEHSSDPTNTFNLDDFLIS
ncbi:MAG: hypothetical protein COA44_06010 [Arcobacter sp.]|nr:MAG: hypothetical protein COA44_06010 [Arcobacter sp.]